MRPYNHRNMAHETRRRSYHLCLFCTVTVPPGGDRKECTIPRRFGPSRFRLCFLALACKFVQTLKGESHERFLFVFVSFYIYRGEMYENRDCSGCKKKKTKFAVGARMWKGYAEIVYQANSRESRDVRVSMSAGGAKVGRSTTGASEFVVDEKGRYRSTLSAWRRRLFGCNLPRAHTCSSCNIKKKREREEILDSVGSFWGTAHLRRRRCRTRWIILDLGGGRER